MADKLKIGDTVVCKGGSTVRYVVEVDPPGQAPLAPSTYVVRLAQPPEMKPDLAVR